MDIRLPTSTTIREYSGLFKHFPQLPDPVLLALAWQYFDKFDATRMGKPNQVITIGDLKQMLLPPFSPFVEVAKQILESKALPPLFAGMGATRPMLLRKLAEFMKQAFSQLDTDGNGKVDWKEITTALLKPDSAAGVAARVLASDDTKSLFKVLAGKGDALTLAGLQAVIKPPAPQPVVPPPALLVLAWKSFEALQKAADKRGDPADGLISTADLKAAASAANLNSTIPAVSQLARLAATLLKSPEWLKTVAGQDGKISRDELTRAVASVVLKSFDALNVVPAGGGITAADLAALTQPGSKAYAAASPATRELAAALKGTPALLAALAAGTKVNDGVITSDDLKAVIRPQPAPRTGQSIARDALANFAKLDVSGNQSISTIELQYLLKELKPGPAVATLAAEVKAQFLSSQDETITRADLQKLALPLRGAAM